VVGVGSRGEFIRRWDDGLEGAFAVGSVSIAGLAEEIEEEGFDAGGWSDEFAAFGIGSVAPCFGKRNVGIEKDEGFVEALAFESGFDGVLRGAAAGVVDVDFDPAVMGVEGFEVSAEGFFGVAFDDDLSRRAGVAGFLLTGVGARHDR